MISKPTPDLAAAFYFHSASRTHPGRKRALNEDRLLDSSAGGLWAVADGMGGHEAGEVAATRLVEALAEAEQGLTGYARLSDLIRRVDTVNAALYDDRASAGKSMSGATLVTLLAQDGHYACLWAGDSRAYLARQGTLSLITHDHSLVQDLIDAGALAEDQRKTHPNAHVVTRAVGVGPSLNLERRFAPLCEGDVFLLCSDGLTACIDDDEIGAAIVGSGLDVAADWLLDSALARGAPDNVSFVLVRAESGTPERRC